MAADDTELGSVRQPSLRPEEQAGKANEKMQGGNTLSDKDVEVIQQEAARKARIKMPWQK